MAKFPEGVRIIEASKPERHVRYLAYLGYAYAASGNEKKGREILEEIRRRAGKQYVSAFSSRWSMPGSAKTMLR